MGANRAGRYAVEVSNTAGTAASAAAVLRVIPSVTVAVFDDPAFVFTGGGAFDQSDSVQASLRRLGHQVTTLTDINQAVGGTVPLLFPAFEAGDPTPTLAQATRDALQSFVARGGVLIVHGVANDCGRAARALNAVFGYAIQCSYSGASFARTAQAA